MKIQIIADEAVPKDEAWLVHPVGYEVRESSTRIEVVRIYRRVGKIVGLAQPEQG